MSKQKYHSLERTSPKGKGQEFIGRCVLCGKTNLPITAVHEPCDNPKNVSSDQSLINAIKGPKKQN